MPQLLSQFDLKPGVSRDRFDPAWHAFIEYLVETDLATGASALRIRQPASGFDTDDMRGNALMTAIDFRDQAQADAAWSAIESGSQPMESLHRCVFALVHDPIFTFWSEH